ncbi:hypothetical protein HPB50_028377 [Hyalomma asiaticum]|nr:hypothetical protein HPB50_028377 [Hyalomma asiaticum]
MAVIAGGETGEPAYGAGGTVSMQKNKANAAGDCDTSPCRYLPEVDTDDTVMIWCSRSQPCQMTQSVPGAFLVEVEQARSSSCGSGHDGLDDEKQGEEGSSEVRDDNGDRLRVDRPVGYAASVGAPPKGTNNKSSCAVSAAGDSPKLTMVLQATMEPPLQDLRIERPS